MSDQTKDSHPDEVLSSLRRIVSDDSVRSARPVMPVRVTPAAPVAVPRLMLTPALRVDTPKPEVPSPPPGRMARLEAALLAEDRRYETAPPAEEEAPFLHAEDTAEPADPFPWAQEPDEPEAEAAEEIRRDEDILRALIRDVLREELQGEMGLRVTRNLQKLVRAEVARALLLQKPPAA